MKEILENIKPTPILVSRFLDIKEKPKVNPVSDDFSDIFGDEQYREHCFKEAKKSFEFVFDKKKILHHLEQKPNEESFLYLKQIRRFGLILRAMYRFVDSRHKCGENLQRFLAFLGKYNDMYWISHSGEIKKEVINNLDKIEFPIDFTNTPEFKEYTKSILAKIEKLSRQKVLPVAKFHSLRQGIRFFEDLMQVTAAENYGGNLHWLFYSLLELSSGVGKVHDDLVEKGLNGEIDYHNSVVAVNPHIASEFNRLRPFIEKVCGLVN